MLFGKNNIRHEISGFLLLMTLACFLNFQTFESAFWNANLFNSHFLTLDKTDTCKASTSSSCTLPYSH